MNKTHSLLNIVGKGIPYGFTLCLKPLKYSKADHLDHRGPSS